MLMEWLIYSGIILAVISLTLTLLGHRHDREVAEDTTVSKYEFSRKQFVMTRAENEFYQALQQALGTSYMIYPQAHLDMFLDHKIKGQSWAAALSVIQRKSVDFLICNRTYYNPLIAVELDDTSHNRPDRQARDAKIDAICKAADMPLVHIKQSNNGYNPNQLLQLLAPYLK